VKPIDSRYLKIWQLGEKTYNGLEVTERLRMKNLEWLWKIMKQVLQGETSTDIFS